MAKNELSRTSDEDHGSRHRSPNYPAVSLPEAVDKVRQLVEKDGKAGAKAELAARHIGFSGAHGTARAVLSALKKFGLTTEQNGRISPTQLAMDILHFPEGHTRNLAARKTAATSPAIYNGLLAQYADAGNLPSEESLRAELVADMNFNPKAVDAFVADFVASLSYAGILDGNRLKLSGEDAEKPTFGESPKIQQSSGFSEPHAPVQFREPETQPSRDESGLPGKKMRELTLPLMENEVAYLRIPVPLSEENYEYFLEQITLLRKGLVAKKAPPSQETEEGLTFEMRRKLLSLGLDPAEIATMSPAAASRVIADSHE